MTSSTGIFDATEKNIKTAKCYNAGNTDGSDRVTFIYTGDAGTVTLTSTGGYLPRIEISSDKEDEGETLYGDGTKISNPLMGATYYFDFLNTKSDIWDKGDAAEATEQKTLLKTGTLGLMTVEQAGVYWNDHGMAKAVKLSFKVAGNCTITIGGCQYSGANDKITMTSSTGIFDATEKNIKTAKCYNAGNTDGSDRVTFTYTGDAGTVTLTSTGGYLPRIEISSDKEDEGEVLYGDGTKISNPLMGATYYFDFLNTKSDIWDKGDAAEATEQKTPLKTGTLGLMTVEQAGVYWNDHGMAKAVKLSFKVAGNCTITIGGCQYSGANDKITMTSSTGTFDAAEKNIKTAKCYNAGNTDGSDRVAFTYTGDAGTVTLTSTGGYLPRIEIVHEEAEKPVEKRPIEVWDFGAKQETDETLYHNNITAEAWTQTGLVASDGTLDSTGSKTVQFGALTVKYENGDKLYGAVNNLTFNSYNKVTYEDGYVSDGLWYCNGKGGSTRRYVTISNVHAGDKVIAYMGSHTKEEDVLHFEYQGSDGKQDDTAAVGKSACGRYEFIADYDGTYKIYVGAATNVKPIWHRIVQVPMVEVTGTVDVAGNNVEEYGIKFINNTTEKEIEATVKDGAFTTYLTPGFSYTAVMTGVVGFGFTNETKTVKVEDTAVMSGMTNVELVVKALDVYELSGTVKGFESGYDLSGVKVVLKADPDSQKENVSFNINSDYTYSVNVESGVKYTITLTGANDYDVAGDAEVCLTAAQTRDITVAKKTVYTVSGSFLGLNEGDAVTSLKFVNMEDKYQYPAAISGNTYTISLRAGTYEVQAEAEGYSTISHVIVENDNVSRDLLFVSKQTVTRPLVKDIYVGCPEQENNYDTVRAAVAACKAMKPTSEADRITVHIAPGTYREQVIVDTPYISFVNTNPEQEVLLTWYYGIGYEYYSIGSDGYYSEAAAFDKFGKGTAQKWGAATYIKSSAVAFRAENITFESSFNKYLTAEEVEDGVAPGGNDKKDYDRTAPNADVASRNATERASALAVEGNQSEFYNCKIVGSQDTMFTGNNVKSYFKNCFIDGNTDYIFGGGDFVFDACELSFYGYSDEKAGAYLTAASDGFTTGYIFRNCFISANSAWAVAPSYLGRPWRQTATVAYLNTKLQSGTVILPEGWSSMSGAVPEKANYKEYNTTILGGEKADTSKRTTGTVQSTNPYPDIQAVFGSWTPFYYTVETDTVELTATPVIEGTLKTGETLQAAFDLGDNEGANASTIQWYRVDAEGKETCVKSSLAYLDRTYTVAEEDDGCYIKVVVKPETISGTQGTEASMKSETKVNEVVEEQADYTEVDKAIAEANALKADDYVDFSGVTAAVNAVERDLKKAEQSKVDAMAKAIRDAIAALEKKSVVEEKADYTEVDKAIAEANALKADDYMDFSGVTTAVNAVERDLKKTEQSKVDAMAKAIRDAIAALEKKPVVEEKADYTEVDKAIAEANALKADDYMDFSGVTAAVNAVERDLKKAEQSKVDAMAKAIRDAIAALEKKPVVEEKADYTEVDKAIAEANALKADDYVDFSGVTAAVNAVERDLKKAEQSKVDAMAKAIRDAIAVLEKKPVVEEKADYTEVDKAIAEANALKANDYVDFSGVAAAVNAVERDLKKAEQSKVDAMAKAIRDAIAALEKKPVVEEKADYTEVDKAIAEANALKADDYVDFSGVTAAVNAVERDLKKAEQSKVDAMAKAIRDAIAALEKKPEEGGDIQVDNEIGENAPTTEIVGTKEEIISKVLTEEEQELVKVGVDISITTRIQDLSTKVTEQEKNAVREVLKEHTIGQYIDISLYKKIGSNPEKIVTQTNSKLRITIQLPKTLINLDTVKTRTYTVIRVHNGVAEVLDTVYDSKSDTLTFDSDQFSTYAIAYKDVPVDNKADIEENKPTEDDKKPVISDNGNKSPQTGDTMVIWVLMALFVISGSILVLFSRKRKYHRL